jgi:hypothetical protein
MTGFSPGYVYPGLKAGTFSPDFLVPALEPGLEAL